MIHICLNAVCLLDVASHGKYVKIQQKPSLSLATECIHDFQPNVCQSLKGVYGQK